MEIKKINEEEIEQALTDNINIIAVIDKDCWGSISQYFSEVLEELNKIKPSYNICKIKCENAKNLIKEFNIVELPTTLIYKEKFFVEKIEGYLEADELEEILDKYN